MIEYDYISLEDVLFQIAAQAEKDVNWMRSFLPEYIRTPQELFYFLKSITIYQDDPKGFELIQSPKTLLKKNYYGVSGMGDCDCFSTLSICAFLAMGYSPKDFDIVLVGRNRKEAVHIYTKIEDQDFDLTNNFFGYSRNYPFLQIIPFSKIWQKSF